MRIQRLSDSYSSVIDWRRICRSTFSLQKLSFVDIRFDIPQEDIILLREDDATEESLAEFTSIVFTTMHIEAIWRAHHTGTEVDLNIRLFPTEVSITIDALKMVERSISERLTKLKLEEDAATMQEMGRVTIVSSKYLSVKAREGQARIR